MPKKFASYMALGAFVAMAGCANVEPEGDVGAAQEELFFLDWFTRHDILVSYFQTLEHEGSVGPEDAYTGAEPLECAGASCERIDFTVSMPHGAFSNPNRPGGLQVAVRWFGDPGGHSLPPEVPGCCGEFDTLNVYLYKDDVLVSQSVGIISTSQSLLLEAPENGHYTAWIVSDPTYNVNPSVDYEAVIEIEYLPRVHPVRPLRPNLEFRSSRTVTFDTPSFPLFEPDPPPGATCFDSEHDEDGANVCLRFDQVIANTGQAAAQLRFPLPTGAPLPETGPVLQRVFRSDGSFFERAAGTYEFHEIHAHYHYSSFAQSNLWRATPSGRRIGRHPVRTGRKVSFCMVDVEIDAFGFKGDGPRTYNAPDCLFPTESDGTYDYIVQGITNGWADIYEWYLPDQYIEVSGVADGYYVLENCADPDGEILESNESDNCAANLVRLSAMGSSAPQAENLGQVFHY
ncbi:MAG: lysyl oxidase family protein [Sandaracinaceae bacterium]